MTNALYESSIKSLPLLGRGKVRDIYAVDSDKLLIVTSDRISAFDIIMPDPIPEKGQVLTRLANFWFEKLASIIPSQATGIDPESVVAADERDQIRHRALVVKRLKPLPVKAVVRGYLVGSGWKDYQQTGAICGITLPEGLRLAEKLPDPVFTPATRTEQGEHDENISFEQTQHRCSVALSEILSGTEKDDSEIILQAKLASFALYNTAADYALTRGMIIADTKFEFGVDQSGALHLIDEVLTPDSSRFWSADAWHIDASPPLYDKQYLYDYLETLDWNRKAPGPTLPDDVIANTSAKYIEAYEKLTGLTFA